MAENIKKLYVLYKPGLRHIPLDALILSFMNPEAEYGLSYLYPNFLFARNEMDAVREKARDFYIDLIARIAATPSNAKTLRQILAMPDRGNPWWYHKISERQVESEDTFNLILQIFTILHIAEREGVTDAVVYCASIEVAQVVATRYRTKKIKCVSSLWKYHPFRGLLSRLKYLYNAILISSLVKRNCASAAIKPEIVFQGIWGQSIIIDEEKNELRDNYFKLLPEHFISQGINCAWFLWFDPKLYLNLKVKSLVDILSPAIKHAQLIFLQKFLRFLDILLAIFDLRPLCRYLCYGRAKKNRDLFKEEECDFWPLMGRRLLYHFCDSGIPHCSLVELSARRAFAYYKPRISFTFLELFLLSRAFYQGAKLGSPETIKFNMQHASWGKEKTFILMDKEREFFGNPDNIATPVPDYFFVMGELGRDILLENGVPEEKIFLTGSARYEHIKIEDRGPYKNKYSNAIKVLLAASPTLDLDFEMVQASVLAARGLNIRLYLRSHPIAKIEDVPLYKNYRKYVSSSTGSLDQELASADLVIFTYSTVAEEAFLKGIPILQWQVNGFNGSVFKDIPIIPRAYSVESLKKIFEAFIENPSMFKPSKELQELVLRRCFYKADAKSSYRIADHALKIGKNGEYPVF